MPAPDERQLMELYRLHSEEVRFQVNLTWDRAKSSLAFHAAWVAIVANMAGRTEAAPLVPWMFWFAAVSAFFGALMVLMGHRNYRAARKRRWQIEENLDLGLGIVSTPGARNEGWPWFRIYVVLIVLHLMLSGLAVVGACRVGA